MTFAISLSPTAEERLAKKAKAEGIDLPTLVERMVEAEAERLPTESQPPRSKTVALLEKWNAEQATDDPEELAQGEQELRELMEGLNESRRLSEGPTARTPFP